MYGVALILGKTLTLWLSPIRLDCDAARLAYVHTIKKLSSKEICLMIKVSAKYAPLPQPNYTPIGSETYYQFYAAY
jgi:hypothetical protein